MRTVKSVALVLCAVPSLGLLIGCCFGPPGPVTLVDRTVTVPAAGGGADVTFNASNGQTIRITLTGDPNTMQPYGHLGYPDASSTYFPAHGNESNGVNTGDLLLTQTGGYTLTVFDGANLGGQVAVLVVRLP
jgi:hypothetical protein